FQVGHGERGSYERKGRDADFTASGDRGRKTKDERRRHAARAARRARGTASLLKPLLLQERGLGVRRRQDLMSPAGLPCGGSWMAVLAVGLSCRVVPAGRLNVL